MSRLLRTRVALVAASVPLLVAPALLGLSPAAVAEDSSLPVQVRAVGGDTASVAVPVPAGITPTSVTAQVATEATGGVVTLLVGEREAAAVVPEPDLDVAVPVYASDVVDGVLTLGVRYTPEASTTGCPPLRPPTVGLQEVQLGYVGTEAPPTSPEEFWPRLSTRVDVLVPPSADDEVLRAGLTAITSLAGVYPAATDLVLGTPGVVLPRAGLGQRVLQLVPDEDAAEVSTEVITEFGLSRLVVTGPGSELVEAARELATPTTEVVRGSDSASAGVLAAARSAQAEVPLADLGLATTTLRGSGPATAELTVAQDLFGGPLQDLVLHLEGTHGLLDAGSRAQLNTYVNDELVDSTVLDEDPALEVDATVPGWRLRPVNRVRLTLAVLPVDGTCPDPASLAPLELTLDAEASTVTGTPGSAAGSGLAAFPQVLGGSVPVAVRKTGRQRVAVAAQGAALLAALQRAAGAPLEVSVVDPSELVSGLSAGLLVGANRNDAEALGAPLPLGPLRGLGLDRAAGDAATSSLAEAEAYATLEVAGAADRPVLVLGTWARRRADGTAPLTSTVVDRVGEQGWSALNGTVLLAAAEGESLTLDLAPSGPPPAPPEAAPAPAPPAPWWLLPGAVVLGLLVLAQVWWHLRTERRRAGDPLLG
ncbi:cellulose biosynthesis cyclic di-GMP-binding regulatory protein BcsB [Nocardioides nanhaiensis]|uniref:Cellulose biosynthesis cyclic di-GMP-binding regulatory protein BcsB n=1 Tax=Nocardioides nanhaiensis TaxID=1476871 RepID=A0ABP8W3N1_9ACTN